MKEASDFPRNASFLKRFALALFGISVMGSGVALTAASNMGVSQISSVPYVVSLITGERLTFGTATFLLNVGFFLFQLCVYRKRFPLSQWLQLPAVAWFGFCIDMTGLLLRSAPDGPYWLLILEVVVGSAIIALGIVFELAADVVYLPGDGMVSTVNLFVKRNFGAVKVLFDFSLTAIAVVLSLAILQRVEGVREGTLIAAFAVGYFVRRLKCVQTFARKTTVSKESIGE